MFGFLVFLCIVAFVVGMIKPSLIMRWAPEGKRNRKWVAVITIAGMIIFTFLAALNQTPEEKAAYQAKQEQKLQEKQKKEQAEAEEKQKKEQAEAEAKAKQEELARIAAQEANKPENKIKAKLKEYVNTHYKNTTIDDITINPDLGTEKDGDYVALVRLTWNVQNRGKTSKEMLNMYSEDMAARTYEDLPEVQELAVFWTVPYLNNGNAKISFERANGGMKFTDTIFDANFNK